MSLIAIMEGPVDVISKDNTICKHYSQNNRDVVLAVGHMTRAGNLSPYSTFIS